MTEATFEPPDHPSPLTLAALARDEVSESEKESCTGHLARCRRCVAIYAEFVQQVLAEPDAKVPPDWMNRAMSVPEATHAGMDARAPKRHLKWVWAGAGALAVIVFALMILNRSAPPLALPDSLQASLAAELRADSQGSLVYGDDLPPEPRGVRGADKGPAASTLDQLLDLYRARSNDPEVAFWLVSAYLASNQLRNADPFLREARQRFPEDARFLNLAAILAYKENKLEEAEGNLRQAVARERTATALVNLAVVHRQQGDENEAETLLREAESRFPDSALSPYIRELAAPGH